MRLPRFLRRHERRDLELSEELLDAIGGGSSTAAGVHVTVESALRLTAVWAAVRVLSDGVASLPFPVYRRQGRSRSRVPTDPRDRLLNDAPNPEMTSFELWSLAMTHLCLHGNAYAVLVGDEPDELELWPLDPRRTRPKRDERTNALRYVTRLVDGSEQRIQPNRMLHLKALQVSGDLGLSPIRATRQALGAAIAAEEYGARFFANDARPGVFVVTQGRLTEEQQTQFKLAWEAGHKGPRNAHKLGILTGGADLKTVGIPPVDAQFIEGKKLTVREVARIFGVPPYLIADLEPGSVSYASVEQQAIDFVVHTLRPWLVRIEQAVNGLLFSPRERERGLYAQWKVDGLLRGDTAARYRAYAANVTQRTLETLRTRLRSVSKRFGDVPLAELEGQAAEIAAWRASLNGDTARYAYTAAMRQTCEAAVKWGRMRTNPAKAAGPNPQPTTRAVRPLTLVDIDAIAVELGAHYGPLVVFAAETGLRPEEWIALERRDVDRDAAAVRVERAYTAGEVVPTTKTKRWRRVPLSARAMVVLDRLPARIDTPLLFPGPRGRLIDLDNWRTRDWYPALEGAGVEKCGPYRLRHTYASNQLAAGVSMFELSKVMGTSVKMLEKVYGHLVSDSEDVIRAKQDAWAAEQLAKTGG